MLENFEVIFLDEDEKTVLDQQIVSYGSSVSYRGKFPEKDAINGVKYIFVGWTNEEKLQFIDDNITFIAKFVEETALPNMEDALFNATLESAKKTNLNATITAGNRLADQKEALEKDGRDPKQIVEQVIKNGKVELGIENTKDDMDR